MFNDKKTLLVFMMLSLFQRKVASYVYCVMQLFFSYIKSVKLDDINAMNVYLLCGFNISNDTLICLAYHKYIQNQQNKTQSKVIHFI